MKSLSLIVPASSVSSLAQLDIAAYRRFLLEQAHSPAVEIIVAGAASDFEHDQTTPPIRLVRGAGEGMVGALHGGIKAASGEVIVILDPHRSYCPQALADVVEGLRESDADLAIAVPRRDQKRAWWRSLVRRGLGLFSQFALGTSDVFSGLMAVRSDSLRTPTQHGGRGSRLVLDLLAWPCKSHLDVPVTTLPSDRLRVGPLQVDDLRQLKRLLDQRFGTFSRLVQFCLVGASGMIVDLTLYALFQVLFARIWPVSAASPGSGIGGPLAAAGALSILIALVWNFTLNRRLTFNDSRGGSILRQFLTYALGNALGIAVSLSLRLYLPLQFGFFARHKLYAAVVGIIIATAISFSMSRWVVFIRRPEMDPAEDLTSSPVGTVLQESVAVFQSPGETSRSSRVSRSPHLRSTNASIR
ncbi:MAG: GtrA family protein [Isosphaeraceae bacterium]